MLRKNSCVFKSTFLAVILAMALGATSLSATVYRQELENSIRFFPVEFYDGSEMSWLCGDMPLPFTAETFSFINIGKVREQGVV